MSEPRPRSWLPITKDALHIAREGALVLFILVLFLSPTFVGSRLQKAGITSFLGVSTAQAEQVEEAVETLETVEAAREEVAAAIQAVGTLPDAEAEPIQAQLTEIVTRLNLADSTITNRLQQQRALAEAAPESAARQRILDQTERPLQQRDLEILQRPAPRER